MNSYYNPKVNFVPKTKFFQTLVLKIYNLQLQIRIRFGMANSIIFEAKNSRIQHKTNFENEFLSPI